MKIRYLIISIAVLLVTFLYFTKPTKIICESFRGKWASVTKKCFTRACYKAKNCGKWSRPYTYFDKVKIGDDLSEAYFRFGNPYNITGETYSWKAFKVDEGIIELKIVNSKVISKEFKKIH